MADLEFTVAMIGQAQAEKGLDNLAKKSDQVAKSEKLREKATEAANKAQTKAGIPTFGQAGASSKLDPFKAAQYRQKQAEAAIRAQQLDQKTQERAQQQAAKVAEAANAPSKSIGARIARSVGKFGGAIGQASGLGEVGALGAGFGALAAGAVAVGATLKLFNGILANSNRLALARVDGQVKEAAMDRTARDMKAQSGVRALEGQGANLLRLESLGPAFAKLAKDAAVSAKGGTSFGITDTQGAVLDAQRGGRGLDATRQIVEAARRLATLSGTGLQEAVKQLQDVGFRGGDGNVAIGRALSVSESRRVTAEEVARREANLAGSSVAGDIRAGRALQARTGLAEQGNLGLSIEALTRQFIDVQNPLINLQADAYRENSTKLEALKQALDEQGPLWRAFDRLTNGINSLSGQYAAQQVALTGGRTDSLGLVQSLVGQ